MKEIAILLEDTYQVLEVWYPFLRLQEAGYEPILVGPEANTVYSSKEGYPAESTLSFAQALNRDLEGVVVPGGYAPDRIRRFPEALDLVKMNFDKGKLTAAICHGGWVLASADILKGKKLTCFYAIKDDLIHAGGDYNDIDVVIDKNLITSRTPDDLPRFMEEIVKFLSAAE